MGSFDSDRLNTDWARITPDGGYAIRAVAGEALVRGELVACSPSANGKVIKSAVDEDYPVGVVYANAAQDAEVWIVVSGYAYTLPNAADTATRDYIMYASSTTAGRVSQSASVPAVTNHNREVGHFIETGSGAGALAKAIIHWN